MLKERITKEPIRVLHVVTTMNLGGIETFLMSLYRNIERDKVQFDFLVHRKERGFFDDEIESLGGRIFRVQPLNPLKIIAYEKELRTILTKNKYSIIHSHLNANSVTILKVAKKVGVKIRIAHSHTNTTTKGFKGVLKQVSKYFITNYCNYQFACSKFAGKWLFGESSKFKILTNAIDTGKFCYDPKLRNLIREQYFLDEKSFVLGNIAGFSYQKNHAFLVDILKELVKKDSNIILLLVGSGELLSEIKEKIELNGLREKVIFTGAVGNANEYLNAMDIFLFPSLFEGLGIVGVEAQTNGLPTLINEDLPKELDLTDIVYRLSIKQKDKWIQKINDIKQHRPERLSRQNEIIKKGYDIKKNALFLQNFYISNERKNI